jgi:hypothetical protein
MTAPTAEMDRRESAPAKEAGTLSAALAVQRPPSCDAALSVHLGQQGRPRSDRRRDVGLPRREEPGVDELIEILSTHPAFADRLSARFVTHAVRLTRGKRLRSDRALRR